MAKKMVETLEENVKETKEEKTTEKYGLAVWQECVRLHCCLRQSFALQARCQAWAMEAADRKPG